MREKRATPHLSLNQRISIIHMRARNATFSKIAHDLNISIRTAKTVVKNYVESRRIGRKKGVWPNRVVDFPVRNAIDESLKQNPFLKGRELQEIVHQQTGKMVHVKTICRARRKMGWIACRTRIVHEVTQPNRQKRIDFSNLMLSTNDDLKDILFTDECSVQLDANRKLCFRKEYLDENNKKVISFPAPLLGQKKNPVKVMVWAGISWKGPCGLAIIEGTVDSQLYCTILEGYVKPFQERIYNNHMRFWQDNAPCHKSKKTMERLTELDISCVNPPPSSPDLNAIENVWSEMKRYLTDYIAPKTKAELIEGIKTFWTTRLTPAKCQRYINHIRNVLPKVIECGGKATGM